MTTAEWISLGSSFGALSAALVALFTLLELSRQRKSAYKPDLCVLKKQFSIKLGRMGIIADLPMAIDWETKDLALDNMVSMASIRIVNVGFGAAKHIKAKWRFDTDSILEEVNQIAQQTFQSFYLEKSESLLSVKSRNKNILMVNGKMDSFEFEYLLPVGNQNNGHEVYQE